MNYTKEQIYEYGMRDIPGYEGLYGITSCGKVWSYRRKIFLKPGKTKDGYLQVTLSKNGDREQIYVHRIVIETYEPCENMKDLQVNHHDECKEHNYLNNLEWMTCKENINYGTHNERMGKAKGKSVLCIETGVIYSSTREAARQTGINNSSISKCCRGIQKTAGGFHWQYID